ncbi:hypothetical protein A4G31_18085 [Mycobacterium persicum]|nr:hypothetical protein A4G31_18085 [Mycobacterium persicum]
MAREADQDLDAVRTGEFGKSSRIRRHLARRRCDRGSAGRSSGGQRELVEARGRVHGEEPGLRTGHHEGVR